MWYDLILLGVKQEEYREIKEYWLKRLFDVQSPMIAKFVFGDVGLTPKDFTHVQFRLGYKKLGLLSLSLSKPTSVPTASSTACR